MTDTYTEKEWDKAIASLGRLVDIRNFPDIAADILLGRQKAFLGRPARIKSKALNPDIIGAVVIWTKGPVENLVEHTGLREALERYNENKAIIGLQLSVTGLGGTFMEPGIQAPEEVATGLKKVLDTGLVDPEAVQIRYDPLIRVKAPNGRIIRNDTRKAFEKIASLFSPLGVKFIETKFLLSGQEKDAKYHHVWERMKEIDIIPQPVENIHSIFVQLSEIAFKYDIHLFSCCVKEEQKLPGWTNDAGCLSADRLSRVAKDRFGVSWDRISFAKRPSRKGCQCSKYFDLSNVKGHKKCGSQNAACIYCTACAKTFGKTIQNKIKAEIDAFCNGSRDEYYKHLL